MGGTRTAYSDTTRAGTTAAYTVDAVDKSGDRSERSRAVTVTTPSPGGVLIAAAGDIACDPADAGFNGGNGTATVCAQKATSDLILAAPAISAVLNLGDNQYGCGGYQPFLQSFDPSWGRFLSKIHPVAGNHEYQDDRRHPRPAPPPRPGTSATSARPPATPRRIRRGTPGTGT